MEEALEFAKTIGGPAAMLIVAMFMALRWLDRRESKCDERLRKIQEMHTSYVEEQTKTVTKALVENTESNRAVSTAVDALEQTLSGRRRAQ